MVSRDKKVELIQAVKARYAMRRPSQVNIDTTQLIIDILDEHGIMGPNTRSQLLTDISHELQRGSAQSRRQLTLFPFPRLVRKTSSLAR